MFSFWSLSLCPFVMIELRELCPGIGTKKVLSAARFDDAYFAVNDVIYKKSHVLIEWVRTGFPVHRIEINKTGTFVALSGTEQVSVFSSDGKLQYNEHFPKGVRKTLWHPLGVDDSCLVVLSAGHVRSLWLGPTGYLTDTFDFSKNTFGAQDSPQFANSMTFGPDNATGDLTLYLATDEGSIFAIAPFLPPKFQISVKRYNQLLDYAATAFVAHQDHQSIYAEQIEWLKSIEADLLEPKFKANEFYYLLDAPDPAPLYSQGPFKVLPYPERLYGFDFNDISAFSYANLHFLVQDSSQGLLFLLIDEATPCCWAHSSTAGYDPTLTLVQLLLKPREVVSRLDITGNLVWTHSDEATTLYEPHWLPTLETSLETSKFSQLEKTSYKYFAPSTVYAGAVDATCVAHNNFTESSRHHYILGQTLLLPEAPQSHEPESGNSSVYHNETLDDLQTLIGSISLTPSGPVTGLPEDNIKSLAKMDALAEAYTQEIIKVYKCVDMAFDSIDLQKIELNNQLKASTELDQKIKGLSFEQQATRISSVLDRQAKISERFKQFETRINNANAHGQPIGQIERRWFRELKGQAQTVEQFSSREKTLVADFEGVDPNAPVAREQDPQDLRQILFRLQGLGREIGQLESSLRTSST